MKKVNNPEVLIKQLTANTAELLNAHWAAMESLSAAEDELKIGMAHTITDDGNGELAAKTVISFGHRVKDTVEHMVDSGQAELALDTPKRSPFAKR